jgi:outer membrane protein assembly factor BamB
MHGTVRGTQWGYSLQEMQVYGTAPPLAVNLALNKIAIASSLESSTSNSLLYNFSADSTLMVLGFNGTQFDMVGTSPDLVAPYPGGILSLSANGEQPGSGVLWSLMPVSDGASILRAYDAENITHELWNSLILPGDDFGLLAKFVPPVVANGKVYVATFSNELAVYGLNRKHFRRH